MKMSDKINYQRECNSAKLSNVRSPADGEEQFPTDTFEECIRQKRSVLSQNQMPLLKECSVSPTPADDATPSYYRWAQNLHNLLNDHEGINLFKTYLKQECHDCNSLDFWFAARGLQDQERDASTPIKVKIIHTRFVLGSPDISPETKDEITDRITNKKVDHKIFDKAQKEVETVITKTTYPNFLKSYLYIQHIQQMQHSASEQDLEDTSDVALTKSSVTKLADGTARNLEGSRDGQDVLQTVFEDRELEFSALSKQTVFHWNKMPDAVVKLKPESQAGHYLKPSNLGYNPYHAKYAAYHPPSAQDSEFQSSTSDAQTDDTMSVVSGSTDCDSGLCNRSFPPKGYDRHRRKFKSSTPFNQDLLLPPNNFIPRTQRLPEAAKPSPEEFSALLTQKLNKLIEDKKLEERLNERLHDRDDIKCDEETSIVKPNPPIQCKSDSSLFNFDAKPVDFAQSILDNHVSRVFDDSAHLSPSPGCMTPSASQLPQELPAKQREALCSPGTHNVQPPYLYHLNQYDGAPRRRDADSFSMDSGAEIDSDFEAIRTSAQRSNHHHEVEPSLFMHGRSSKESSRRSGAKKQLSVDCGSSCFDSGISGVGMASCTTDSKQKVTTWLEMKYSSHGLDSERESNYVRKSPSSSPMLGQYRKPNINTSYRTGPVEGGAAQWAPSNVTAMVESYCRDMYDSQSIQVSGQVMSMSTLTNRDMLETRRRLESVKQKLKPLSNVKDKASGDVSRSRGMSRAFEEDATLHKKNTRKSCPPVPMEQAEETLVAYKFGRGSVPFMCRLPGKCITLKQFKCLVSKKENLRFFFKTMSKEFGLVFEEFVEDSDVLPLWEGKIFCQIEQVE